VNVTSKSEDIVQSSFDFFRRREVFFSGDWADNFNAADIIKVQSYLAYSRHDCCLFLTAHAFETISRVRVVVN
jgi:hypothetical protein